MKHELSDLCTDTELQDNFNVSYGYVVIFWRRQGEGEVGLQKLSMSATAENLKGSCLSLSALRAWPLCSLIPASVLEALGIRPPTYG